MCPEGLSVIDAIEDMLDVPVRRQHQRGDTAAGLESLEILRCQRVQPAEPVGPGHRDDAAMRQVDHSVSGIEQPLLAHRVAVMPGHTDIRP